MTLPTSSQAWPPPQWSMVYDQYSRNQAWYAGDVEALQWLYATNQLQRTTSIWGQVRRLFWGTPTPQTTQQRPNKLHVPMADEIAQQSAAQLFSEMPNTHFGDMDGDADDIGLTASQGKTLTRELTGILEDRAHSVFLEAAELQAALGGVFLRVTWDQDVVPDHPFLTAIPADQAIPTFQWGRLTSVIFWRDLAPIAESKLRYKLLEEHNRGTITYGLYQSASPNVLGRRVDLNVHPDLAGLATIVNTDGQIPTGTNLLTAVYVPNKTPNSRFRTDSAGHNLGRSDFDGAVDLFDAIDETYSSWMRDIRLGKARVFVDRSLLQSSKPGQSAIFNADQEIFTPLNGTPVPKSQNASDGTPLLDSFQPNIRWQEYQNTAEDLIGRTYSACGYSAATFGESGDVAMTATEAQAREKLTLTTRSKKILHWGPALSDILAALMDVNATVFGGPSRGQALPKIEFPDGPSDAPQVVATTLQLLNTAEATSVKTRVAMLHPDWDKEQVDAEVTLVKADLSMLPLPEATYLQEAVADNASATGGVKIGRSGLNATLPTPAQEEATAQAADQATQAENL